MLNLHDEDKKVSVISALYSASFALLASIGALSMAFANFWLGALLFSLGVFLIVGNEYMLYRRALHAGHKAHPEFFTNPLASILGFVAIGFILPSMLSLYLFFIEGFKQDVLIISLAGLVAVSVKLVASSARFFLTR